MANKELDKLAKQYAEFGRKYNGKVFKATLIVSEPLSALPKVKRLHELKEEIIAGHHKDIGLPVHVDEPGASAGRATDRFDTELRSGVRTANKGKFRDTVKFPSRKDATQFRGFLSALQKLG